MGNIMRHARRELELLGEEPETIAGYTEIISAFEKMGHSGGSASVAIPTINTLLQQKNLLPLTDDPYEWNFVAEETWGSPGGIWQNNRNGEAFSNDEGKTYYLISEGGNDRNRNPLHTSVKMINHDPVTGSVCRRGKRHPSPCQWTEED